MSELQGTEYRETPRKATAVFHGYPPPYSNTIYAPNQFLSVVLPNASLNCIRLVAYLIEKALAWADGEDEPTDGLAWVPYSLIAKESCVSRSKLQSAIDEALDSRYIVAERFGKPIEPRQEGYPANYSLKWSTDRPYTEDPDEFDGFFGTPDGKDGNRTHIPKSFFEHTIPDETRAVIQVVGAIMRYTIGFELRRGYRRRVVKMSWRRLQDETNIGSPNTLKDALDRATKGSHIEVLEEGIFDPKAGANSRPAVYTLKWTDGAYMGETKRPEVVELDQALEQRFPKLKRALPKTEAALSQNNSGTSFPEVKRSLQNAVPETEAEHVPKVNRETSQNRSDIEITLLNNSSKPHQQERCAADDERDEIVFDLIQTMRGHGLSYAVAKELTEKASATVIRDQCEWIDQRVKLRNKQGALRTAILENWPRPGQTSDIARTEEEVFIEGFYQGWSGGSEEGLVPASQSEVPAATRLLKSIRTRIQDIEPREAGKRFGQYAWKNERESKKPIAAFIIQARNHGMAFVEGLSEKIRSEKQAALKKAREQHEEHYQKGYEQYIDDLVALVATEHPEVFDEFIQMEDAERERKKRFRSGSERAMQMLMEYFERPESRRERFMEFFGPRSEVHVPSFWEWDEKYNPESLKAAEKL